MDDQYIRGRALAVHDEASTIIEQVQKEYDPVQVADPDESFSPAEVDTIDEEVSAEEVTTHDFNGVDVDPFEEDLDGIKQVGVQIDSVDMENTRGHQLAKTGESLKARLEKIEKLNERMKEIDSRVRFVATKADAPENAYVYDVEGIDYYFKIDDTIRPSDVTEINKDDSWWLYDENERVLKTILALADRYPEPLNRVEKVEQAYTFTDRVLKTEDEVLGDEDAFTLKQQDAIVAVLVQARDY